ncbi:hypothetical protein PIB30_087102 [Stylosanthes scabra]|uniref:Uncharacterized protein n=1 Tax=Stylosanthes scabra TaxID=79078 RepID=A0ABU6ZRY0_9FABA|nr:hypothetical protein [Stylosanthes scabra]
MIQIFYFLQHQADPFGINVADNVNNATMNPIEKAKKNKKKIPTPKPGVRVKPPKKRHETDEIPISQGAPNAEENGNASQNLGHNAPAQASNATGLQAAQRMKQPIIRPQIPPMTNPRTKTPIIGVSAETMAATSSGTAARLFEFMPTPGFKPPRKI